MPIAAVPRYLGQDFRDASPGLRFGMYLAIRTSRTDQEEEVNKRAQARSREGEEVKNMLAQHGMDVTIQQLTQRQRHPLPGLWQKSDFAARQAWEDIKKLTKNDIELINALANRQRAMLTTLAADAWLHLFAIATAPFTTGLGNEHPLENGFAFLNPYGLPYLPGSGVKGVVRRSAQELAGAIPDVTWGDDRGWKGLHQGGYRIEVGSGRNKKTIALSVLDVLFGREPPSGDSDAVRGALSFWDVIPQIKGGNLLVEVMTPHQTHYYRNGNSPHDSGQPTPIYFLTVPPGSSFHFFVTCDEAHLKRLTAQPLEGAPDLCAVEDGKPKWQRLLVAAFEHAFEWLGFGAKTAVGYGAMAVQHQPQPDPGPEPDPMTPTLRRVQDVIDWAKQRLQQYSYRKKSVGSAEYQKLQELAKAAKGDDWSAEDKAAAAQAIEEWGPKLIDIELKDLRKRLELDALRPKG